jgi:FMN phosphatase YigB (HAD superfamily)
MIKAVVFDFGNVISEPHDIGCYRRMADLSGLSEAFFGEMFWKYRADFDRGTLRAHAMYRRILADACLTGTESELDAIAGKLVEEDLASWFHISESVTEWGRSLKASGLTLGILSNMPHDFLARYRNDIALFNEADVAVFSCECGLIKPDMPIYRELIRRLGCRPDEIAFFDDLPANIEGARAVGINAFLWIGLDRAKADLAAIASAASP